MMTLRSTCRRIAGVCAALAGAVVAVPAAVHAAGPLDAAKNLFTNTAKQAAGGVDPAPLESVVGDVIQAALSLVGVVFLVLMVYGGYLWMTARGESDQLDKAKKILTTAVIGLAITLGAYAVSIYVVTRLTSAAAVY